MLQYNLINPETNNYSMSKYLIFKKSSGGIELKNKLSNHKPANLTKELSEPFFNC